jgi:hypothetical protein
LRHVQCEVHVFVRKKSGHEQDVTPIIAGRDFRGEINGGSHNRRLASVDLFHNLLGGGGVNNVEVGSTLSGLIPLT